MDKLLAKTKKYSDEELRQMYQNYGIAEKEIAKLEQQREEANKKIRETLEEARSEAREKMIVNGVGAIAKLVGPGADIAEAAVAKRKQCHNHMSKKEMEKCITHNEGVDKTSGIINGVKAGEKVITTAVDIYNTFKE